MNLLKGREHASRFLSTFIVNELESRVPATDCIYLKDEEPSRRRTCRAAFEAITFEVLRDVNGVTSRSYDPLFTIVESEMMQARDGLPDGQQSSAFRTCESCRIDYATSVDVARDEFWRRLPKWFDLDLQSHPWA